MAGPPLSSGVCRSSVGLGKGLDSHPVPVTPSHSICVSTIPQRRLGLSLGQQSRLVFCKEHLYSATAAASGVGAGTTGTTRKL